MNQDNYEAFGSTDGFENYFNVTPISENGYSAPKEERYGMTEEEYDSFVANREETLELCNAFHAFYAANSAYHLAL